MAISSTESNVFLKKFIDQEGKVDYAKIQKNNLLYDKINEIENKNLESFSSKEQELAFWLNTYNLLVLKGVLHKLYKNPSWNGTTNFFSRLLFFVVQKFKVGNKKLSLYTIENKILRAKFKDPRIHFAINCASSSCPVLPSLLFTQENVNQVLDQVTENFINNNKNVSIDEQNNIVSVNTIFKWYQDDFREQGGILQFIEKYRHFFPNLSNPKLLFFKYDWTLNKQ